MFANWGLEALKWRILIKKIENISFSNAFKAVWTGVTAGTITPNRIGEFGGRILFVKPNNRQEATTLTLFGDLAQMTTTLIIGICGISYLFVKDISGGSINLGINILIFVSSIGLIIICNLVFFNYNIFLKKLIKIRFLQRVLIGFMPSSEISSKEKITALFLSFTRYAVFSFQFYLSLRYFGIEISLLNAFAAISSMYLAIHVVPNISVAEIGVRLSFAVIFIGIFTYNHTAIGLASLLIYIINIVIPVIVGSVFIMKIRLRTTKN
jgi:hypothetical protein